MNNGGTNALKQEVLNLLAEAFFSENFEEKVRIF